VNFLAWAESGVGRSWSWGVPTAFDLDVQDCYSRLLELDQVRKRALGADGGGRRTAAEPGRDGLVPRRSA
jgi:hypothetical protein